MIILWSLFFHANINQCVRCFICSYFSKLHNKTHLIYCCPLCRQTINNCIYRNPVLLSVDQCEDSLTLTKNTFSPDHRFYNMLVAMCITPWKVDVFLGSHGNMGYTPACIGDFTLQYKTFSHEFDILRTFNDKWIKSITFSIITISCFSYSVRIITFHNNAIRFFACLAK